MYSFPENKESFIFFQCDVKFTSAGVITLTLTFDSKSLFASSTAGNYVHKCQFERKKNTDYQIQLSHIWTS